MHNLIVLGSGRSGTSLVTGVFQKAGYFMGDDLYAPRPANPKGFFECEEINSINEEILFQALPPRPKGLVGSLLRHDQPGEYQMWLARVPIGTKMSCPEGVDSRIRTLVAREPFCFKDPRFSYTLPSWRPFLKNTRFLVVFRHPSETAKSTAKECKDERYLRNLSISREQILETWKLMYSHIIKIHRNEGRWLFLHFDQALEETGLDLLESFAEAPVDRSFPEKALKRSTSHEPVSSELMDLYEQLCHLANYPIRPATENASK